MRWIDPTKTPPNDERPVIVATADGHVGEAHYYQNGAVWLSDGEAVAVVSWMEYPSHPHTLSYKQYLSEVEWIVVTREDGTLGVESFPVHESDAALPPNLLVYVRFSERQPADDTVMLIHAWLGRMMLRSITAALHPPGTSDRR